MFRKYRTFKSVDLLEIAFSNKDNKIILEEIIIELQERNNTQADKAVIKVGQLLEAKKKEDYQLKKELEEIENTKRLRRNLEGYFDWPLTDAPASRHSFTGDHYFYKEGLLSFIGYRVGRNGTPQNIRHQLLDCVFHNELPNVDSPEYMEEWDEPRTANRLKKLAESMAAFTRNAKRKMNSDYSIAVEEWEDDLEYLYRKYYVGYFRFSWPSNE